MFADPVKTAVSNFHKWLYSWLYRRSKTAKLLSVQVALVVD